MISKTKLWDAAVARTEKAKILHGDHCSYTGIYSEFYKDDEGYFGVTCISSIRYISMKNISDPKNIERILDLIAVCKKTQGSEEAQSARVAYREFIDDLCDFTDRIAFRDASN